MPQMMATPEATVTPNWAPDVQFPQRIRVQKQVAAGVWGMGAGIFEIVIHRPDQPVPALIIRWMQGDPRYRTWFLQEPPAQAVEQAAESQDEPVESADDKPKRGRPKKTADGE